MRIAVPTDFSELSKIAVQYAVAFAKQAGAELVLLHILPRLGPTMGSLPTGNMKEDIWEEAGNKMQALVAEIKTHELKVEQQLILGGPLEEVLEEFSEKDHIDLVIMGSKGATGLKKVLLGSNTVAVINNGKVPVIVVPDCATIEPVQYLVYASDFKHLESEINHIVPYARLLNVVLRIIHVPEKGDPAPEKVSGQIESLKKSLDFDRIELEILDGNDVVKSIEAYTEVQQAELLVMFTHHENFLEQIFTKSFTRELAWGCTTPLLVITNRA